MTELRVRRLRFHFDADVAFQWNRGNPHCGNLFNLITLIGPAFERYFIQAVTAALPRIRDERVRREAALFCQQEGQHARHHVAHLRLLNERYPGLDRVHRDIVASYDALRARNGLDFNLAYMASLELLFTPFAIFAVRNVERMFGNSDPRVASFMLWHLVEEYEHRRCAAEIYDDVVGDWWFRMKCIPPMVRHLREVGRMAEEGIDRCVPPSHNTIAHQRLLGMFRGTTGCARLLAGWLGTLRPGHRAGDSPEPAWIRRWLDAADDGGIDMALYYPPRSLT